MKVRVTARSMRWVLIEEQLLKVVRRIPSRQHEPLIQFLSTCVRDRERQRN